MYIYTYIYINTDDRIISTNKINIFNHHYNGRLGKVKK